MRQRVVIELAVSPPSAVLAFAEELKALLSSFDRYSLRIQVGRDDFGDETTPVEHPSALPTIRLKVVLG